MTERSPETGRFLKRNITKQRKKVCLGCGEKKWLGDFYKLSNRKNHPDGYDCRCKACRRKERREADAKNRVPEGLKLNKDGVMVIHKGYSTRLYWGELKTKDFKRRFPYEKNADLAIDFCCSVKTVIRRAREMGLEKDPAWLHHIWDKARGNAQRINKLLGNKADLTNFIEGGKAYRFKKKAV